ncbi:Vacuolar iron transporter [Lachnellula subtilissima]|uniref:Vacuolar iron transporter n=1 Tax=Lachnellula subtilissima TaxID=602034 RepID=A0A8H8U3Q3_9HELO|nr:Vacuolar iron transporter [Lachnellula subtilissima]
MFSIICHIASAFALNSTYVSAKRRSLTMESKTSTIQSEPTSEIALAPKMTGISGQDMPCREDHKHPGPYMRDIILGFSDGLTVPFALTAGLSSLGSAKLVILGGLAELFSGAISMGLGGLLAALTERSHYFAEEQREKDEVRLTPQLEREEIYVLMEEYDVGRDAITPFVNALVANEDKWVKFMMDFELKMEKVEKKQAWISAGALAGSYFAGGFIPIIPYFAMKSVTNALFVSIGVTVLMLLVFGFVKNKNTVGTTRCGFKGAAQTLVTGVLAAGASYGIVRALDSRNPVLA